MAKNAKSNHATATLDEDAPAAPQQPAVRHVAHSVFVVACSTGKRGAQDDVPMHEVPLLRRMLKAGGEDLVLARLSDPGIRVRGESMESVTEIYQRLRVKYTFVPEGGKEGDEIDLVGSVYGNEREGLRSLAITMRALKKAYDVHEAAFNRKAPSVEDLEDLIAKNGPEKTLENELLDVDLDSVSKRG